MQKIKLSILAWLLPVFYLVHLLEEYYAGETFPVWFSRVLGADLSKEEFIWINSIGMSIFLFSAILYTLTRRNAVMVAVLGTVLFLNGFLHLFSSILSFSYSPGTISGLIIYIPMGYALRNFASPALPQNIWLPVLLAAVILHIVVATVALTI